MMNPLRYVSKMTWAVRLTGLFAALFVILAVIAGWVASGTAVAWVASARHQAMLEDQGRVREIILSGGVASGQTDGVRASRERMAMSLSRQPQNVFDPCTREFDIPEYCEKPQDRPQYFYDPNRADYGAAPETRSRGTASSGGPAGSGTAPSGGPAGSGTAPSGGPAAGGTAPSGGPPAGRTSPRVTSFHRLSAYYRLDGHPKLGGVLIGRPPESEFETIDTIEWTQDETGQIHFPQLGEAFAPGVVELALKFAADGFPVAVTIQLETSEDSPAYKQRKTRILDDLSDMELSGLASLLKHLDDLSKHPSYKYLSRMDLSAWRSDLNHHLHSNGDDKAAVDFIDSLREYLAWILAIDQGVYLHPILENTVIGCNFVKLDMFPDTFAPYKDYPGLLGPEPREPRPDRERYIVVSQVRMAPYDVHNNALLGQPKDATETPLWPFLFTRYVYNRNVYEDSDRQHWREYSLALRQWTEGEISTRVKDDKHAASILGSLRDFVLMQRLFRLSFVGLVNDMEYMIRLAAAVEGSIERMETPSRMGHYNDVLKRHGLMESGDVLKGSECFLANDES